jgi:hypothetical protein
VDTNRGDIALADTALGRGWLDREPERGLRLPARPGEQIEGFESKGNPLEGLYVSGRNPVSLICRSEYNRCFAVDAPISPP